MLSTLKERGEVRRIVDDEETAERCERFFYIFGFNTILYPKVTYHSKYMLKQKYVLIVREVK